jgi:hypothetical protein
MPKRTGVPFYLYSSVSLVAELKTNSTERFPVARALGGCLRQIVYYQSSSISLNKSVSSKWWIGEVD